MATPTALTADMLRDMAKIINDAEPQKSLLMSAGFRQTLKRDFDLLLPASARNPILSGYTQSFMGIDIVPVDIPPEEVIDWSGCRSPSRAKRRHAKGIPQRIKIEYRERAFLIHRDALRRMGRDIDARLIASLYGI